MIERSADVGAAMDEAYKIEARDAMAQRMMSAFHGYEVPRKEVWSGMWRIADAVLELLAREKASRASNG